MFYAEQSHYIQRRCGEFGYYTHSEHFEDILHVIEYSSVALTICFADHSFWVAFNELFLSVDSVFKTVSHIYYNFQHESSTSFSGRPESLTSKQLTSSTVNKQLASLDPDGSNPFCILANHQLSTNETSTSSLAQHFANPMAACCHPKSTWSEDDSEMKRQQAFLRNWTARFRYMCIEFLKRSYSHSDPIYVYLYGKNPCFNLGSLSDSLLRLAPSLFTDPVSTPEMVESESTTGKAHQNLKKYEKTMRKAGFTEDEIHSMRVAIAPWTSSIPGELPLPPLGFKRAQPTAQTFKSNISRPAGMTGTNFNVSIIAMPLIYTSRSGDQSDQSGNYDLNNANYAQFCRFDYVGSLNTNLVQFPPLIPGSEHLNGVLWIIYMFDNMTGVPQTLSDVLDLPTDQRSYITIENAHKWNLLGSAVKGLCTSNETVVSGSVTASSSDLIRSPSTTVNSGLILPISPEYCRRAFNTGGTEISEPDYSSTSSDPSETNVLTKENGALMVMKVDYNNMYRNLIDGVSLPVQITNVTNPSWPLNIPGNVRTMAPIMPVKAWLGQDPNTVNTSHTTVVSTKLHSEHWQLLSFEDVDPTSTFLFMFYVNGWRTPDDPATWTNMRSYDPKFFLSTQKALDILDQLYEWDDNGLGDLLGGFAKTFGSIFQPIAHIAAPLLQTFGGIKGKAIGTALTALAPRPQESQQPQAPPRARREQRQRYLEDVEDVVDDADASSSRPKVSIAPNGDELVTTRVSRQQLRKAKDRANR